MSVGSSGITVEAEGSFYSAFLKAGLLLVLQVCVGLTS